MSDDPEDDRAVRAAPCARPRRLPAARRPGAGGPTPGGRHEPRPRHPRPPPDPAHLAGRRRGRPRHRRRGRLRRRRGRRRAAGARPPRTRPPRSSSSPPARPSPPSARSRRPSCSATRRPPSTAPSPRIADGTVTLDVTEWYRGGPADQVTVDAPPADMQALVQAADFQAGQRYLVSGERRLRHGVRLHRGVLRRPGRPLRGGVRRALAWPGDRRRTPPRRRRRHPDGTAQGPRRR